jgi:hypothetical protein
MLASSVPYRMLRDDGAWWFLVERRNDLATAEQDGHDLAGDDWDS